MMLRLALLAMALLVTPPARAADRWFLSSDGARLHYTEAGRGRTVVLVPGWTMPGWIFAAQVADLSRQYRVVAFDPRGQGESEIAATGYEPNRRGEDIADLLRVLGPDKPVVVGWSLGVLDVLAYVHAHGGDRLAALILVDNSVGEEQPPPPPPPSPREPRPRRHAAPVLREVSVRRFVRGMFARLPDVYYLERLSQAALRTPAYAAALLLAYPVPRTYWRDALYSAGVPVLYLVRPRLAAQAENLAAHDPDAESVVLQGVGHAMFVDDAPRFDALVRDFIRRRVWP